MSFVCYRCESWPCVCSDGISLIHGDCREVLPQLEAGCVGITIADPPYGIGKADWDVFIPHEEWLPLARKTKTAVVFCGVRGLFDYPKPDWTMAWVRIASMQRNGRFRGFNNWEPILVYGAKGVHIANDTFSIPNIQDGEAIRHPTTKPVRLICQIINNLGGGSILAPFAGSGTTLVAAKQLNRRAIGIEIEEKYCRIAAERLRQGVLQFEEAPCFQE